MKATRFTELLNLALDHELAPAESAELQAELQRDPARRQQFRDYQRMQHACARLFEREQAQAPASFALGRALLDAERKLSLPVSRPFYRRPAVAAFAGFATMAACVTLVLLHNVPVADPIAAPRTPVSGPVAALNPLQSLQPAHLSDLTAVTIAADTYQTLRIQPGSALAANDQGDGMATSWMQQVALAPVQPVRVQGLDLVSPDSTPSLTPQTSTSINAQFVGFQFQR